MSTTRHNIHAAFVLALPVIVAWYGWSVATALFAVFLVLVWRWAIVLSHIFMPDKSSPPLILETIAASHFVEKVRWCMDRLELDYTEKQSAGVLGVFFTGRTVPRLKIKTGLVQSVIGNSPEILRYLWATQVASAPQEAEFLEPTQERIDFEKRLDGYGRQLQVWVYYHILDDRQLTLRAWGSSASGTPHWQRAAVKIVFPLLAVMIRKSFSVNDAHYAKAVQNIEALFADIEARLADGRVSLLGDAAINYTDIEFAAMSGLWLQPPNYGGGNADEVRIEADATPEKMQQDVDRWTANYPQAIAFIERLYAEER